MKSITSITFDRRHLASSGTDCSGRRHRPGGPRTMTAVCMKDRVVANNRRRRNGSSGVDDYRSVSGSGASSSSCSTAAASRFRLWDLFSSCASNNNDKALVTSSSSSSSSAQQPRGDVTCTLKECHIRPLLNSIGLYPSVSQIVEMVHCACRLAGREPPDHVTFGEFSVLITELQERYRRENTCSSSTAAAATNRRPRSQLKFREIKDLERRRSIRRISGQADRFQVFLGGSCNPTTWRNDIAIPFFKRHSITYYNPQVSSWRPELIEIEDLAKQAADVLFFVIDSQTRSIASLVEAAYLAGCGRQLLLVIKPVELPIIVAGETLDEGEVRDLKNSYAFLTDMVERMSIPVFSDINVALECARRIVKNNINVTNLTLADGAEPVRYPHIRVATELIKIKDVFVSTDSRGSGELSIHDVQLAYKTITGFQLPHDLITSKSNSNTLSFEDFCCLLSEFRYTYQTKSLMQKIAGGFCMIPQHLYGLLRTKPDEGQNYHGDVRPRDVFLGGSCSHTRWRDDIAIPLFLKHGVSYYNPQMSEGWTQACIALEATLKEVCRLLLFVITEDTRAITSMLEAAHYIGRGCNVVLCIQNVKDGVKIGQEILTDVAVKDYNRARAYLSDMANRDGTPVFDNVHDAVMCAINRLNESPCRSSKSPVE